MSNKGKAILGFVGVIGIGILLFIGLKVFVGEDENVSKEKEGNPKKEEEVVDKKEEELVEEDNEDGKFVYKEQTRNKIVEEISIGENREDVESRFGKADGEVIGEGLEGSRYDLGYINGYDFSGDGNYDTEALFLGNVDYQVGVYYEEDKVSKVEVLFVKDEQVIKVSKDGEGESEDVFAEWSGLPS